MATALVLAIVALVVAAAAVQAGVAGSKRSRDASFVIARNLQRPLRPGVSLGVNLRFVNTHAYPLLVRRVRVRVEIDEQHRKAGCVVGRDIVVQQMPARAFPFVLPAGRHTSLRRLAIRDVPRVEMPNLRINQDACKGAKLRLRYTGSARPLAKGATR